MTIARGCAPFFGTMLLVLLLIPTVLRRAR